MFTVDLTTNSYLIKNTEKESNNIFSDINVISNAATHYSNPDILLNIIKSGDFNEINNTLKDDSESYVGWTHVADYKSHPLSRNLGKCYYIHARINRENNLEFGIFDSIINSKNFKVENILHTNEPSNRFTYTLKIANKEESEKFLLSSDKKRIKVSALPKYAGYLNDYSEEYRNGHIFSVYGNVWTYWYTVSNNTLYFCGFPLLADTTEKGLIYDTNKNIVEAELPPTSLNYSLKGDSKIKLPLDLIYKNEEVSEENEYIAGAKRILSFYGDNEEITEVGNYPIAYFNTLKSKNYIREDVMTTFDSFSMLGGAYQNENEIVITDASEINLSFNESNCFKGNSGFYPFVASYINKKEDGSFTYYENAQRINGFFITIINNSLQIIVGDSVYYLGSGTAINPSNPEEWDDGLDITTGGGGGGGWSTNLGGGGDDDEEDDNTGGTGGGGGGGGSTWVSPSDRDDDDTETKRNTPPIVINCGDIGYEYRSSYITSKRIRTVPSYEVYGNRYRDKDAVGHFEYDIDIDKLDSYVLSKGYGNIDDTKENILSKKLSRKLIISGTSDSSTAPTLEFSNALKTSFENFFPLPNNIQSLHYMARQHAVSQEGGVVGEMALTMKAEKNGSAVGMKPISANRSYNIEANWANGDFQANPSSDSITITRFNNDIRQGVEYKYTNNVLEVYAELYSKITANSAKLFESIGTSSIPNKKIKVTNNLFQTKIYDQAQPTIVCSFHPTQNKCPGYDPKKVSIRYTVHTVKLIPQTGFIKKLLNQYATTYQTDSRKLEAAKDNIDIRCGDKYINSVNKKVIDTEIKYIATAERNNAGDYWNDPTTFESPNTSKSSQVEPFKINFDDIKLELLGNGNQIVGGSANTTNMTKANNISWGGYPKMQLNLEISQGISKPQGANFPIGSVFIPIKVINSEWWESDTENYTTDLISHRFRMTFPEIYKPTIENSTTSIVVELFSEDFKQITNSYDSMSSE